MRSILPAEEHATKASESVSPTRLLEILVSFIILTMLFKLVVRW